MNKWADWCISHVRYNVERTRIVKVLARPDSGTALGDPVEWTKSEVITAIEGGTTFITVFKTSDGKWKRGAEVLVVVVEREKFLRTDRNQRKVDNLGELPEF